MGVYHPKKCKLITRSYRRKNPEPKYKQAGPPQRQRAAKLQRKFSDMAKVLKRQQQEDNL